MTTATPSLRRLTPQAAVLLLLAAVAWLATMGRAATMRGMTGTMGLGLAAFVGMWALMKAAMMLPSVAPVASMYQRSVRSCRALRLARVHQWVPARLGQRRRPGLPPHRAGGADERFGQVVPITLGGVEEVHAKGPCSCSCQQLIHLVLGKAPSPLAAERPGPDPNHRPSSQSGPACGTS
jgi:hypothetical protein